MNDTIQPDQYNSDICNLYKREFFNFFPAKQKTNKSTTMLKSHPFLLSFCFVKKRDVSFACHSPQECKRLDMWKHCDINMSKYQRTELVTKLDTMNSSGIVKRKIFVKWLEALKI